MNNRTDSELYREVTRSNRRAFRELFERYWDKLFVYCFNILQKHEICEDIIQEIFIELWERRQERELHNVQGYLFRAVKLKTLNVIRNTAISAKHLGLLKKDEYRNTTEESVLHNELRLKIDQAVGRLPGKCKEVFILSRFEQLSHKTIADRMGISVQTVKNHINKALSILRETI
jgi:RNA polymerase sigma-70 factor (ECF subfamily)